MKNQVLTNQLLTGIEAIQKFNKSIKVDKKNKALKDISDSLYLEINQNRLIVNTITWEGNHQLSFNLPILTKLENMKIGAIGLETLVKALKKFDIYTYVTLENNRLEVTDGKKKIELKTVEHTEIKQVDFTECNTNVLNGIEFKTVFDKVKKTVATNETRPILTGIHFKNDFIESLDGYRISQIKLNNVNFKDFVLSPFYVGIMTDIAKKYKTEIKIINTINDYMIDVSVNDLQLTLTGKMLEGEYFKTESVFCSESDCDIVINFEDKKELLNETEFISDMLGTDGNTKNPVIINVSKDNIELSCTVNESTTKSKIDNFKIDTYRHNDNFKIALNPKYLLDVLKNIDSDKQFTIAMIGNNKPVQIFAENERYLILPMRIDK